MTNTFTNEAAFPITISQLQRIAETLQRRMQKEEAPLLPLAGERLAVAATETKVFSDRAGAGAMLATKLEHLAGRDDVSVVGIPRGGIPVAAEIARHLGAPMTAWVVQRLQASRLFATTLGALAEDGEMLIDEELYERLRVAPASLMEEVRCRRAEIKKQSALYREVQPEMELCGRTVVVVDDGMVSGQTVRATLLGLRRQRPGSLVLVVPVASQALVNEFSRMVDEVVTLETTQDAPELQQRYVHFPQVSSDDVVALLRSQEAGQAGLRGT